MPDGAAATSEDGTTADVVVSSTVTDAVVDASSSRRSRRAWVHSGGTQGSLVAVDSGSDESAATYADQRLRTMSRRDPPRHDAAPCPLGGFDPSHPRRRGTGLVPPVGHRPASDGPGWPEASQCHARWLLTLTTSPVMYDE